MNLQSVGTKLEDICYKMYCWDPVLPGVCSTKSPAALGTSCGPRMVSKKMFSKTVDFGLLMKHSALDMHGLANLGV